MTKIDLKIILGSDVAAGMFLGTLIAIIVSYGIVDYNRMKTANDSPSFEMLNKSEGNLSSVQ